MGSIAALLIVAALAGLAGPALCGTTRSAAMPCCETPGDCEQGIGRPACCVDLPVGGTGSASPAGVAAANAAQAEAPSSPLALAPVAAQAVPPGATGITLATDSPPLHLLHSVFLC